jgi:hypothetical protein
VGLKDVTTGDTLCDLNKQIILERMEFPEPVISVAVEPKSKADQEKMAWLCRGWRKRILLSEYGLTRSLVKPLFQGWVSCI